MAEDIVGGLFGVNPAMYQQQQQQQVFNRAVALQNLNPFQQAAVGVQQAGYNLAGALGGALGGVDPQLQRISALNAISKQIDQSSPESMMSGAKMLADAGFQQEALGLAQYARKANSELALAKQRMNEGRAAAIPKEVQIAEYVSTVKTQLGQLQAMEQTPDVVNAINLLQSRLDALPQPKEAAQNADIVKAQRAAEIVRQLAILKGLPEGQQSPDAIRSLETELAVLSPAKAEKENADVVKAQRIGELVGQIDVLKSLPEAQQNPALIRQLDAQLASLSGGSNKVSNFAQELIDRGFKPGSVEFNARMDDYIKKQTALPAKADATTNEIRNALAVADLSGYAKDTPEYNKVFKDELARLTAKPAAADKPNIKEIGVSAKGDAVYLDVNNDEQFIFKIEDGKTVRVPYAGTVDRTTAKVSATVNAPAAKQKSAFAESRGKTQDQQLLDATTNARAASQALTTISTMKQLDKTGQLVTGPLANSYVGASNLLASIGLLSANQVSILTSSQVYDKSAKDLVMQDLGGKLGAQISDADRKFVEDRIPQLTTSAKARTELLDKIEQIQKGKIAYYKKMNAHANKYGDLNDFDFSEVYSITPPAAGGRGVDSNNPLLKN